MKDLSSRPSSKIECFQSSMETILMIIEAIIESLKDLKQGKTTQEADQSSGSSTLSEAPASTTASNEPSHAEGLSHVPTNFKPSVEPALEASDSCEAEPLPAKESSNSKNILSNNQNIGGGSSSGQDAEMAAGTRATLVVQKSPSNPASNVMEGLAQRWGNLFRNSR